MVGCPLNYITSQSFMQLYRQSSLAKPQSNHQAAEVREDLGEKDVHPH